MKSVRLINFLILATLALALLPACAGTNALDDSRPRILVSTDIGGLDFDYFQSMVHLLVYADRFDVEGLVSSSTGGPGRKADILRVIDSYEHDYPNLKTYSDKYPTPDALHALCKQGSIHSPGLKGYDNPTEGSEWIIQCARRPDPRPLWILEWAGIDDVAQALHDDSSIAPKLRVYLIGGPNKKWSTYSYDYIAREFPNLWVIEDNSSYYGWFVGGDQSGQWGNAAFVADHIAGRGALGDFFANLELGGKPASYIKMRDTPSVAYLLHNPTPENPTRASWGGQFVRAWNRPHVVFDNTQTNPPTAADRVQTCGIAEIVYRPSTDAPADTRAALVVDKQEFPGFMDAAGAWHFLYSPKQEKTWSYKIKSTFAGLNGRTGAFTSVNATPADAAQPTSHYPNWWTDNPDPALADDGHPGAKTLNRWRLEYLSDFAARMERCKAPASWKHVQTSGRDQAQLAK